MANATEELVVRQTTDYAMFKTLTGNRQVDPSHVKKLAKSLGQKPEVLRYRPILVNERMEVLDGQHRLAYAKEVKAPVYYMVGTELDLGDTQRMNANQRNWNPIDYARSYSALGNHNYDLYLEYRIKFGRNHRTTLRYMSPAGRSGNVGAAESNRFRNGQFKVIDSREVIEERFERLADVWNILPKEAQSSMFEEAYLTLLRHPDYDHQVFYEKFRTYGGKYMRRYSSHQEYLRGLEATYNERTPFEQQITLV